MTVTFPYPDGVNRRVDVQNSDISRIAYPIDGYAKTAQKENTRVRRMNMHMDMSKEDKARAAKASREAARLTALAKAEMKKKDEPMVLRTGGGLILGED